MIVYNYTKFTEEWQPMDLRLGEGMGEVFRYPAIPGNGVLGK